MTEIKYDSSQFPEYLQIYYKRLFPYGPYYKWLTYGLAPQRYYALREFSFTLQDDVYIRYQSFNDQQEMEKEIQKKNPYKIDIGAVFNHKPRDHKMIGQGGFQAMEKELVFDIDLTDYDEVRFCCQGSDICSKCWPFMSITVKVIDRALRDDFGFEHLLWVYSGRRGIHCWVCDETARKLTQEARTAVVEYLSLVKGGVDQAKKVNLKDTLHPFIQKSVDAINPYFNSLALENQDILGSDEKLNAALALITDESLRKDVEERIKDPRGPDDSVSRWELIAQKFKEKHTRSQIAKGKTRLLEEIMLQYIYPRLDVNVSTGVNHLLKSPFCIHPKTGRVCVPIDPTKVDEFSPESAPIITDIINDLDKVKEESRAEDMEVDVDDKENTATSAPAKRRARDYNRTRLRPAIIIFEDFLDKLSASWKGKQLEESDKTGLLNF